MKYTTHTLSDGEILRQSIKRPWMFSMLVDRYQAILYRKSLSILKNTEAAEDAVADTFLKIYKNAHQFSPKRGASFKSWVYKILINTCYTELARRNRNSVVGSYEFADLDVLGSVLPVNTEEHSYVDSVLSRMPKKLSRFLQLYFFEEKSQKEIADSEQMSETAVRSRIHRAKKIFKTIASRMMLQKEYLHT